MHIERTIRCPRCQRSIEREIPEKGGAIPGSPFRRCPDCGRLYFDEAYAEPALAFYSEKQPRFSFIKIVYAALPTMGALLYLKAWRSGENPNARVPAIVFSLLALFLIGVLVHEIVTYFRRRKAHQASRALLEGESGALSPELRESLERLRDTEYLKALEKYEIEVPRFFKDRAKRGK